MFETRKYIGMPFEKAQKLLQDLGFNVVEVENTADDRHAFDTKLVVRVDVNGNQVTLITAKFLMNI